MKVTVNINACDLDNDDTVCGFSLRYLILFANMCHRAGIEEKDLKTFYLDTEKHIDLVRQEYEEIFDTVNKALFK